MDFSFNESQTAVAELARKIFQTRVTPQSLKATEAQPERIDRALWSELASVGLLATALPESAGGSGYGLLELCALLEEAGASLAAVPLWSTLLVGAMPVAEFGTDAQRARLLPGVASGDTLLTAGLSEAANDDPMQPATTARRAGDAWVLRGVKECVPMATARRTPASCSTTSPWRRATCSATRSAAPTCSRGSCRARSWASARTSWAS
jgi:alkylation response protein AidB-like acyl-CoA dehydrogenase